MSQVRAVNTAPDPITSFDSRERRLQQITQSTFRVAQVVKDPVGVDEPEHRPRQPRMSPRGSQHGRAEWHARGFSIAATFCTAAALPHRWPRPAVQHEVPASRSRRARPPSMGAASARPPGSLTGASQAPLAGAWTFARLPAGPLRAIRYNGATVATTRVRTTDSEAQPQGCLAACV